MSVQPAAAQSSSDTRRDMTKTSKQNDPPKRPLLAPGFRIERASSAHGAESEAPRLASALPFSLQLPPTRDFCSSFAIVCRPARPGPQSRCSERSDNITPGPPLAQTPSSPPPNNVQCVKLSFRLSSRVKPRRHPRPAACRIGQLTQNERAWIEPCLTYEGPSSQTNDVTGKNKKGPRRHHHHH